jgi:hypothetical protein
MKTEHTYCDKVKQLILLEDSGELTSNQAAELSQHIEQCPDCANYKSDLQTIFSASKKALPDGAPSDKAIENILTHAESDNNVVYFSNPWRIAAGIAAVFAVILSTYLAVYTPDTKSGGKTSHGVGNVQMMVALASDGDVDTSNDETGLTDEAKLQSLAEHLLKLQGFAVGDQMEPEDITDLLLPTALQWRNTPGFPEEKDV